MTSKERLLKTLKHEIPDKIPWALLVNNFFLEGQKDKYKKMSSEEFVKEVGGDLFNFIGFKAKSKDIIIKTFIDGKLYKTEENDWLTEFYYYFMDIDYYRSPKGRIVERRFITPLGELSAKFTHTPNSHTVFITEYLIKKVEDYKIFAYMIENLEYEDQSQLCKQKEIELGNDGINVAYLHSSPAYELIQNFMGLERFLFFLNDYEEETIKLMNIMFEKFCQCYKSYSENEVPVIFIPEDASTTLYSPKIFDKYLKPVLIEYCKIIKTAGKISIMHACGHLKNLTKSFSEIIGLDCIDSVSPPPTGNVNVSEFKKAMNGVCIMGGIPANAFLYELDDFKRYIRDLLLENKENGNFILCSGSSVPGDAKIENIKVMAELVEKYGKY